MIGYLRGRVIRQGPEAVLLDVHGVGYEVHVSLATYSEIEQRSGGAGARDDEGDEIGLHVFTHVWSDGMALYGFWTELEKRLFEKLIAVSGIGPRLARVILSGMPPEELIETLAAGDSARLTTIPGVGKKSAERMVVELREKVAELETEIARAATPPAAPGTEGVEDDLVSALVNLGYKRAHAERAVAEALREAPDEAFHTLLRSALKRLAGG
jgi:Holliday junction DNA helicase RuvA